MRRYLWAVPGLVCAALLVGVLGASAAPDQAIRGSLVIDKTYDVPAMDPGRAYSTVASLVGHGIYETLMTYKTRKVTKPELGLAKSLVISNGGRTFTFKLRSGIRFSDGTPMTSADVVFSLRRVKNLKASPSFLLNNVVSVRAKGPSTVVLHTNEPMAALPAALTTPSLGILNSKVVKAQGGTDAADAAKTDKAEKFLNKTSAGSGPYVLESFSTTTQTVLRANKRYWGGSRPGYDRIIVRNVQASAQKVNVQAGATQIALDIASLNAAGLPARQFNVIHPIGLKIFYAFANADPKVSALTANPAFRKAVRKAIDYKGLAKLAGQGSKQTAGVIPSGLLGGLPASAAVTRDLAGAKASARKAGAAGESVELWYPSDYTLHGVEFQPLAERLQSNLREAGISITLKPTPTTVLFQSYGTGKIPLGLVWWAPDFLDPANYLTFAPGEKGGLRAGWPANRGVTAAANKAATAVTGRGPLFQKFQRELNAKSPFFPLISVPESIVSAKSVHGITPNALWVVDLAALRP